MSSESLKTRHESDHHYPCECCRDAVQLASQIKQLRNFTPTPKNINALPEGIRQYVSDLATRCDPAGEIAELTLTRDQNEMLAKEIERLQKLIAGRYQTGGRSEIDYQNEIAQLREALPKVWDAGFSFAWSQQSHAGIADNDWTDYRARNIDAILEDKG